MKKLLAIVLALVMALSLMGTAFAGDLAGTYDIKVWCPEAAVELTKTQIDNYNKSNTDGIVINATVEAVGEGDAATSMITDAEAGGVQQCRTEQYLFSYSADAMGAAFVIDNQLLLPTAPPTVTVRATVPLLK